MGLASSVSGRLWLSPVIVMIFMKALVKSIDDGWMPGANETN